MSDTASTTPTPPIATSIQTRQQRADDPTRAATPVPGEPGGTDPRDLYTIIWALFLFIRICLYVLAIWIFFHSPTAWVTLGWLVLLLIIARVVSYGHRWAWIGYRANSEHGATGSTKERVRRTRAERRAAQVAARTANANSAQSTPEAPVTGNSANRAPEPPAPVQAGAPSATSSSDTDEPEPVVVSSPTPEGAVTEPAAAAKR